MSGTHLKGYSSVGTRDASHWTKDPRSWVRISGWRKELSGNEDIL